jgi:hypothetical protein
VPQQRHRIREDVFHPTNDCHSSYWLGFLYADGGIRQGTRERDKRRWSFEFHLTNGPDEQSILEQFTQFLGDEWPLNTGFSSVAYRTENQNLCLKLLDLGITYPKITRQPPKFLMCVSCFVRGFSDGDGSFTLRRADHLTSPALAWSLGCASNTLFYWLVSVLYNALGFDPFIRLYERPAHLPLLYMTFNGAKAMIFRNWIYKHEGPYLARKRQVAYQFLEPPWSIRNQKFMPQLRAG